MRGGLQQLCVAHVTTEVCASRVRAGIIVHARKPARTADGASQDSLAPNTAALPYSGWMIRLYSTTASTVGGFFDYAFGNREEQWGRVIRSSS